MWIGKFDTNGNILWSHILTNSNDDRGEGRTTINDGEAFMTLGRGFGAGNDIVVARLQSDGNISEENCTIYEKSLNISDLSYQTETPTFEANITSTQSTERNFSFNELSAVKTPLCRFEPSPTSNVTVPMKTEAKIILALLLALVGLYFLAPKKAGA
jgi:hypothetical protein